MAKTYTEIPLSRPQTPLLDGINNPEDLRKLNPGELVELTDQLRAFILFCVWVKLAVILVLAWGVAELTVALHYVVQHAQ